VQRFEQKGHVLKYVWQKNRGLGGAIDTGLKYVTGEYLTLLDADDRFLPGSISVRAQFLDAYPDYVGVRTNGWRVNGEQRSLFVKTEEEKQIEDLFTALSTGKTNNWSGTYMIRTGALFEIYPDRNILPSRLGQNFQLLLPVSYKRKFGYNDTPLMEYIIYQNSHSRAADPKKQYEISEANAKGWKEIYEHVLNLVIENQDEREHFHKLYNEMYYRRGLYDAASYGNRANAEKYYRALVAIKRISAEDRVVYYRAIGSVKQLFWKAMLKMEHYIKK
jgi:glycosyltransferase involved in cell wall biosynthesis